MNNNREIFFLFFRLNFHEKKKKRLQDLGMNISTNLTFKMLFQPFLFEII